MAAMCYMSAWHVYLFPDRHQWVHEFMQHLQPSQRLLVCTLTVKCMCTGYHPYLAIQVVHAHHARDGLPSDSLPLRDSTRVGS